MVDGMVDGMVDEMVEHQLTEDTGSVQSMWPVSLSQMSRVLREAAVGSGSF